MPKGVLFVGGLAYDLDILESAEGAAYPYCAFHSGCESYGNTPEEVVDDILDQLTATVCEDREGGRPLTSEEEKDAQSGVLAIVVGRDDAFRRLVALAETLGVTSTRPLRRAVEDAINGQRDAANHSIESQIGYLIECDVESEEIEAMLREKK